MAVVELVEGGSATASRRSEALMRRALDAFTSSRLAELALDAAVNRAGVAGVATHFPTPPHGLGAPGHPFDSHRLPTKPASHMHTPRTQVPWPAQVGSSQACSSHAAPTRPASQTQLPPTQSPA